MTKPNQRFRQVAGALLGGSLRNPFFWGFVLGLPSYPGILEWLVGKYPLLNWVVVGNLAGGYTNFLLGGYAANYRWQLLPHYRRVYLTAGGILAFGLLALPAAWSIWCSPQRALPCVGLGFLMFSFGCCGFIRRLDRLIVIGEIALVSASLAWPEHLLAVVESWPANLACVVVGGILLARYARWLLNLDEDDVAFALFRRISDRSMGSWLSAGKFDAPGSRGLKVPASGKMTPLARLRQWRLEWGLRDGAGGFAWNFRRWNLVSVPSLFPLLAIPVVAIAVWAARQLVDPTMFEFVATGMLWGTGAIVMVFWIDFRRRPTLGIESLRPVTRIDFIRQWGCVLLEQLACLVAVNIVLAFCAFGPSLKLAPPGALAWWSLWTVVPFALAGFVSWLRTYGPVPWELLVGLLVASMLMGLVIVSVSAQRGPIARLGATPAVTVGFVLSGVCFFWATYRRWLVIDLE